MNSAIALVVGWLLDLVFGDPARLPHPIVWFGRMIAFGEHHLNHGTYRKLKGALLAVGLILSVFVLTWFLRSQLSTLNYCSRSMPLSSSIVWQARP